MSTTLNQTQLQQYCREHDLSDEARDLIARIRYSSPVRRVQGRAGNVSGFYPSLKMGVTIQYESESVELGAIYLMDHDDAVLEFYEQPHTFKLNYLDKKGKRRLSHFYTPDFLVLRKSGVVFEEWKTEDELFKLAEKQPFRYQRAEDGSWHCPPAEEVAQAQGLSFCVCSSAQLPRIYIDNLDFLADYFITPPQLPETVVSSVRDRVQESPGITIAALLGGPVGVRANDVYALIAASQIYVDLNLFSLRDHYRTHLFADQITALAYAQLGPVASSISSKIAESVHAPIATNTRLLWDGRIWTLINLGETATTLLPETGEPIQLSSAFFLRLLETHTITLPSGSVPNQVSQEIEARMAAASPADRRIANERFSLVNAYFDRDAEQLARATVTERTIRRWARAFQEAKASFGSGYIGLLPNTSLRGNRTPKAPEDSHSLLESYITNHYETPRESPAWEVYLAYRRECETKQIIPLSARTFYRHIHQRAGHEQTLKRQGAKAAYGSEEWYWELSHATPRHGNRPFAVVHMDHTELDIMLLSSVTGKPLGKPWVTFLMDAYSRRLLAVYLTFDQPSYRSCMMTLRICVQRFGRLPHMLVVDGGKDFQSEYFNTLAARYSCLKKNRPGSKPRFGSVIERLFDTANTEFVYNLLGNTQAAKRHRQMTKEVDPRQQAVWTLADLYEFLCEWAYETYDQTDHSSLFQSPREAYTQGLVQTGEREHRAITYDDEFLRESSPSTRKKTAKIERGRGIKIHGIYYSALALRSPEVEETEVEVRFDPFDIGVAHAFVKNQWVLCVSQYHTILSGHTEKERMLASKEIRRHKQLHTQNRAFTARRLADLLAHAQEYETIRQQRIRDVEGRSIHEALAGTRDAAVFTTSTLSDPDLGRALPEARDYVDIASLPVFEELH